MAATASTPRPIRSERSLLSVPASSERFFAKAVASAADVIMLDLEDAVAPEAKEASRARAVAAVNGVMVPKVNGPRDVQFVETLLAQVALSVPRAHPIHIEAQMESSLGLTQIEATAASSPRLEAVHFGPGDYGASLGTSVPRIGGPDPDYAVLTDADPQGRRDRHWSDAFHYALARTAAAAHAHELRPIDGPYVDFNDPDGFRAAARRAKALGYEGKWCIHPSQIELANEIFSPTPKEVAWAEAIVKAMADAHAAGTGAVTVHGQMVDLAHVRQAERILAKRP